MKRLNVILLVLAYLLAITAANLIAHAVGPSVTPYTALGLVGLALITRDRLADAFGFGWDRWLIQAGLILGGSLLAWIANPGAAQVAIASAVAFGASESVEALIYYGYRKRSWLERANKSGLIGAGIDSIIFTQIAFGAAGNWGVIFGQFTAKTAGCFLFSVLIGMVKVRKGEAAQARL
jgi:uncharacterized PurR-regulated membrane protein YhhQ (DUF165 family)